MANVLYNMKDTNQITIDNVIQFIKGKWYENI